MEPPPSLTKPLYKNFLANGARNGGYHDDEQLLTDQVSRGESSRASSAVIFSAANSSNNVEKVGRNRSASITSSSSPYTNNYRIPHSGKKVYQSNHNTPSRGGRNPFQHHNHYFANGGQNGVRSSLHGSLNQLSGSETEAELSIMAPLGYGGRTVSNLDVGGNKNNANPYGGSKMLPGEGGSRIFGGSNLEIGIMDGPSFIDITETTVDFDKHRSFWEAMYDYDAQGEDELSLRRGEIVEVLSKDAKISGDEGKGQG